jgi:colanic acid/amylovoran biosynthesis glycosyltransferase
VVSDAEGLSENILDKQTGWVVPKGQPKLLAESILEVLQLEEQAKKSIQQKAMERVQNGFTLEQQKDKFKEFYEY